MAGPSALFAQTAPDLGKASPFVLFADKSVTNNGHSTVVGDIGTKSDSIKGFENVNGILHINDVASIGAAADLNLAYHGLTAQTATDTITATLGNGQTLGSGVHFINGDARLTGELRLDAKGNKNAVFLFHIKGDFNSSPFARIVLLNSARASNIFWSIDGTLTLASNTTFKGTAMADSKVVLNQGTKLEGRALSLSGAVTVHNNVWAIIPVDLNSPLINGPLAPALGKTSCYALFTDNGTITNTGQTTVDGYVGTNSGTVTGFENSIHRDVANNSTAQASADLNDIYTYLNALKTDIVLPFPALLNSNLVLTPHVYGLNADAHLTDTLVLDALGNTNAVFVINITGKLTTAKSAYVLLQGGAKAQNVFWKTEGDVEINDNTHFVGTIVAHNGNVNLFNGGSLHGRAFAINGDINTYAIDVLTVPNCIATDATDHLMATAGIAVYPSPAANVLAISGISNTADVAIFDGQGRKLLVKTAVSADAAIDVSGLNGGIYFVKIDTQNGSVTKKFIKL